MSFQQIENELSKFNEKTKITGQAMSESQMLKETIENRIQQNSSQLSRVISPGVNSKFDAGSVADTRVRKDGLFNIPNTGVKRHPCTRLPRGRGRGAILLHHATEAVYH